MPMIKVFLFLNFCKFTLKSQKTVVITLFRFKVLKDVKSMIWATKKDTLTF